MVDIKEIHGNIFNSTCQTIVNTVNCVGVMGKGIALEYKMRYPDMFESYAKICRNKLFKPGLLQLWTESNPWILNFPTKFHWKKPSKIKYIEQGLQKFSNIYESRKISSIAFPLLGTFSGGLKQDIVLEIMYKYLRPLHNIEVEIYHYDPDAKDNLFDKLYQKIYRFNAEDYKKFIGLKTTQANKIIEAIESDSIHSMIALQGVKGIGERSLKKIYDFLANSNQPILTTKEIQLTCPYWD